MSLYFTPDRAFPNEINYCGLFIFYKPIQRGSVAYPLP